MFCLLHGTAELSWEEVVLFAVWLEGALDARDMRRTLCVWYERGDAEMRARMGVQVESLRVSVKHKTWCCHWTGLSIKARVSSDVFPQGFFTVWEHIQNIPTFMSEQFDLQPTMGTDQTKTCNKFGTIMAGFSSIKKYTVWMLTRCFSYYKWKTICWASCYLQEF